MVQHLFEEIVDETFTGSFGDLATLYEQCRFEDCDFTGVNLSRVTFVDCSFRNCNLSSVNVAGTVMNNCHFCSSKLMGINISEMAQETLALSFEECRIDSVIFDNVVLAKIQFGESEVVRCEFLWSDLCEADFAGCDLRETRFQNCNLEKTDFRNAVNIALDIRENRVKDAKFSAVSALDLLLPFGVHFE